MSCGFRLEVQAVIQVRCVVLEALWVRNMSLDVSCGRGVHQNHPGRRRGRGRAPLLKQNGLLGPPRHVVWRWGHRHLCFYSDAAKVWVLWGLLLGPLEMLVLCLGLWAQPRVPAGASQPGVL